MSVETQATNTGQNLALTRDILAAADVPVQTVLLISKPYMERRAFATCRKVWPDVRPICTSEPISFDTYLSGIGDAKLVVDMLVGDLQRLIEYPALGFATAQKIPPEANRAYQRLVDAGYTSRMAGPPAAPTATRHRCDKRSF
jgi:uncharacterized SAM-binding protein YcdF (DUF218 family)